MNNNDHKTDAYILRQKALELLKMKMTRSDLSHSESETLEIFHELEVYQIELELQNEELVSVRSAAQISSDKYIALYDFAPSGYFTLSKDGLILELNLSGAQMLGRVRSRLKNNLFGSFVDSDTKAVFYLFLRNVFNSTVKETCEVTFKTYGNLPVYVYLTGIITDNGEQCLVNVSDISDIKKAELALIIANKELAFQKEEKEKRAAELINAKVKAEENEAKEKLTAELIIANKELAFQNEEKEKRAVELSIANKELAYQNEEKEKRAVELIIAKEQAEEHNRLKSAFLANMNHEIRTPMNGILGFTELLKEPELTGERQQQYINMIEKGGARLLNIINDLINISKVESGQMEIAISKTNINEQIEYIYSFFKPEVQRKGLQMFIQNSLPAKEAVIKTDREKIYAILTNLVNNAIKFSDSGTIEFGYNLKAISEPADDEVSEPSELEFFVKDTGIGIPLDKTKDIFERFVQADIGDKRAFQGAGLGLSISKAYVEMLGGKIWVDSEEGKGSSFYFTIPYNIEADEISGIENIVPRDEEKQQINKLKILIADDDESSAMLLTEIVKKFRKDVLYASTGVEAIEAFHSNPDLDLILMDIQMPVMDGNEATKQIRQFNKDIVIIAQTAYALTGDRAIAIEAGCNDYISKPIHQTVLIELIKKHFN